MIDPSLAEYNTRRYEMYNETRLRRDVMRWNVCRATGHDYRKKGKEVVLQKENKNYVYKACHRCGNHKLDYQYRWT